MDISFKLRKVTNLLSICIRIYFPSDGNSPGKGEYKKFIKRPFLFAFLYYWRWLSFPAAVFNAEKEQLERIFKKEQKPTQDSMRKLNQQDDTA